MPARIHRRTRLILGLVAVLLLVTGGTAVARAMTGDGGTRYRTATAEMASVEQLLTGVGSISAVNQASVSFPVSGTVAAVSVSVGSTVSAGQTLATLSTTGLNQSLDSANSAVATAQQTLASDQASQTESTATESALESTDSVGAIVLTAAVTPAPSARPSGGQPSGSQSGSTDLKALIAQVTAGQKAVIAAQQKLDQDLTEAESALTTCQNALSPSTTPPSTTPPTSTPPTTQPAGSASPTVSATASATVTAAASTPAAGSGDATCLAAIAAAPTKADAGQDQQSRDAAEASLDAAIQKLEQAAQKAGTGSGGSSGKPTSGSSSSSGGQGRTGSGGLRSTGSSSAGNGTSGNSSSGNGNSGTGSTGRGTATGRASAAQLAADQAQIDAARAQLVVAQQDLKAATLTSPLAGTVAAVSITAGKSAGGSSITVIGTGQSQVTTTVALADIDKVKVGDPATVKVDGISQSLTGKVSLIGILNSTSGSSTSYPVTILLDPTGQKLYDGSGASTQIRIAQVGNVLTVPSSAVRTLGQFASVSVLTGGKPVTTRVTVGAAGTDRTQILTGLKAGQQVVLANLSEPLPTSSP